MISKVIAGIIGGIAIGIIIGFGLSFLNSDTSQSDYVYPAHLTPVPEHVGIVILDGKYVPDYTIELKTYDSQNEPRPDDVPRKWYGSSLVVDLREDPQKYLDNDFCILERRVLEEFNYDGKWYPKELWDNWNEAYFECLSNPEINLSQHSCGLVWDYYDYYSDASRHKSAVGTINPSEYEKQKELLFQLGSDCK